jgi:DNA-binding beta-propeller fold protein YncE
MKSTSLTVFGLAISAALAGAPAAPAADGPYSLIKEIPVGGQGGWDYLFVDSPARRLYVSHATKVVVIDLDQDRVVGEITNTPGVHGFAVAPALHRGFASNGRENTVSIVDLKTLETVARVETGENPDAILFEPKHEEVYAFNGRSHSATVIAAGSGKVVATIALSGRPEFAACDPQAGRIYDNLEDKNAIAVIDTERHEVVATWPIAPGEAASGMAIDLAHHRLFVGCGDNKLMLMLDSTNGKVLASVPIGAQVDANSFDPGTGLAFSSNGEGTVTIARQETPDTLKVVQTLPTERGAKTMTLDPTTHKIYLGAAKFEPAKPGAPQNRPTPVPGSFRILVYGVSKPSSP